MIRIYFAILFLHISVQRGHSSVLHIPLSNRDVFKLGNCMEFFQRIAQILNDFAFFLVEDG